MPKDLYNDVVSNMEVMEEPSSNEVTPNIALDIIEVSGQTDKPDETTTILRDNVKYDGVDVSAIRNMYSEAASDKTYGAIRADIEMHLSSRTPKENAAAIRNLEVVKDTGNQMFSDPFAGKTAREAVDNDKFMEQTFEDLRAGIIVDEDKVIDVRGGEFTTGLEKSDYRRGLTSRYLSDIFFLPMLVKAVVDDKTWAENKKEYEAWEQHQANEGSKSAAYAKGNGWRGSVLGFAVDPIGGSVTKAPLITGALTYKILKSAGVAKKLSGIMGNSNFLSLASRSGDSLVDFFRNDEKMIKMILEETSAGTDPVSKKFFDAATTAAIEGSPTSTVRLNRAFKSPMAEVADTAILAGDIKAQDKVIDSVLKVNNKTVEGLESSQEMLLKAVDAGDVLPLTLIPGNINTVITPLTKFGTDVNNATSLADVAANQIVYDVATKAQRAVANIDTLRIGPAVEGSIQRAVDFGNGGEVFQKTSFMKTLLPGPWKFKAPARKMLIDEVTKNKITQSLIKKALGKQLSVVYRGLSGGDEKLLNKLIYTADNMEDAGIVVEGGVKFGDQVVEATPNVIDKFYARQIAMKNTHKYLNSSAVAQARKKGWKTYKGQAAAPIKYTDIDKEKFVVSGSSADVTIVQEGIEHDKSISTVLRDHPEFKLYEISDYNNPHVLKHIAIHPDDEATLLKEMSDNHKLIGDVKGYQRVEYKDKYRVFSIERDGTGGINKITPVATSDTWRAAKEFIGEGEEASKKAAMKGVEAGIPAERVVSQGYFGVRASEGVSDFMYSPAFWDDFSKMTDEQMEVVNNLFKEGGLSKAELDDLFAARDKFGYKRPSALKERGVKRLPSLSSDTPQVMLGKDADASYFDWVSRYLSEGDYISQLEKEFVNTYGEHFPSLTKDVYDPINPLASHPLASEAAAYQNQILTIAGRQRSAILKSLDKKAQWAADKFVRSDNKAISTVSENFAKVLPLPSQTVRKASSLVTTMALGSFGLVQLPLQFSAAAINSIGATAGRAVFNGNPTQVIKSAVQAQLDFTQYLATKVPVLNKIGTTKKLGKSMRETWDFVEQSGIAAGIDYDEVGQMLMDAKSMGGWTGFLRKPVKGFQQAGATFYKQGENLGQVYALLMSRRLLEAEGKFKVGSKAFNEAVLGRSKVLALNMAKHNSSALTQNELTSILLKFKDFGVHQGALFAPGGKQGLTKGELTGLYATWMGLFGLNGVPFSWDAMIAAEMVTSSGDPDGGAGKFTVDLLSEVSSELTFQAQKLGLDIEKDTIKNFVEGGLPTVLNDEVRVASRFAISNFFSDYMTATRMDEAMLGAVYSKIKRFVLEDTTESYRAFTNMLRDGELSLASAAKAAEPLANQFSGVAGFIRAGKLKFSDDGILRDTHGRALIVQPTLTQRLMIAGGLTPGELVRTYQLRSILSRQKKAIKEYVWEESQKIVEDGLKSPESGRVSFDLICSDLVENGYAKLIPLIAQRVYGKRGALDKALSAEQRLFLEAVQEVKDTGHFNTVMKELHGD